MRYALIISIFCSTLYSCGDSWVLASHKKELNGSWDFKDPFEHSFDLREIKPVNIFAEINHTADFPYENLYLRSTVVSQSDTLHSEIESYMLQDDLGQWIGKKKSDTYNITIPLTTNLKPSSNQLNIIVEQYSRDQSLKGIESVEILLQTESD